MKDRASARFRVWIVLTVLATALAAMTLPDVSDTWAQSPQPTPTSTPTSAAPTPTDTPVPPTPTDTPVPPTPTDTPVPPTPTPIPLPPTLGLITIDPPEGVAVVDIALDFTVFFTDPGLFIDSATWDWGDGNSSSCPPSTVDCTVDPGDGTPSTLTGRHTYSEPGVYTVQATVVDIFGQFDTSTYEYIVTYDAAGGFVTGGGLINSPAGAYVPDPTLTGEATFGFVSKYKKGQQEPTGKTAFQFHVADLNFYSDSYDWLVVAGSKAMFKGTGTINGGGTYGFLISAVDENLTPSTDVDLFRIKIWDKDYDSAVVYDNQLGDGDDADPTMQIGGGNIVIHK